MIPQLYCPEKATMCCVLGQRIFWLKKAKGVRNQCLPPVAVQLEMLPTLYKNPLPVKKEKKKNLVDICAYIPNQEYREFYMNLPSTEN